MHNPVIDRVRIMVWCGSGELYFHSDSQFEFSFRFTLFKYTLPLKFTDTWRLVWRWTAVC